MSKNTVKNISLGVAGGSGILSGWMQIQAANSKADSMLQDSDYLRQEILRIHEVTAFNLNAIEDDERYSKASAGVNASARGVTLDNTVLLDIAMEAAKQRYVMKDTAMYEARIKQQQRVELERQAESTRSAGILGGITSTVSSIGQIVAGVA